MNIIKQYLTSRRIHKRIIRNIKHYLASGFYYFNNREKVVQKICLHFFNIKIFLQSIIVVNRKGKYDRIPFLEGQSKIVLFFNDRCLCSFKYKSTFFIAKENYYKYIDSFIFPHPKIISFDDNGLFYTMEKIDGIVYCDHIHIDMCINYIFETIYNYKNYLCSFKNGVINVLSHGDLTYNNILWIGGYYSYIDLDFIGDKPLLFDCFSLSNSANYGGQELYSILDNNRNKIKSICGANKNSPFESLIDELICDCIYWLINNYPQKLNLLTIFDEKGKKLFPQSYSIVKNYLIYSQKKA